MNDSHVEFDEGGSGFSSGMNTFSKPKPKGTAMVRLLMKTGIIKDESQAPIVMIIIMIICFGLAAFIFWSTLH